jgi:hypothetical protein
MGAETKQIINDSGITIRTKTGSKYTGGVIKTKDTSIFNRIEQ